MRLLTALILPLLAINFMVNCCHSEDWPQFLGADRNGVSQETGLIDSFPDSGPKIVWRKPLGVGMSNLGVSNGVAFTMYQDASDQFVVAMDAQTGEKKWESKIAPVYKNSMGNGPRATPTVHDGAVYSFSGEGVLTKLDVKTGDIAWSVNTPKELGGKSAEYGMASSPLIVGDCVVVQVGSANGAVAAFDLSSGDKKWAAGNGAAGYSSPVALTLAGKEQVVAFCGAMAMGIDPTSGKELWQYPFVTEYDCNTASPVQINDDSVLISAGENHGSVILQIVEDGNALKARSTWESLAKESVLRAEWQTPVISDGHLYALDNIGSAGPITNLVCVRIADGKRVWQEKRFGKSNLTLADGKLFISTMDGELVIVPARPQKFTESARVKVLGMTRQAPVISDGMLFLRDDKEVVCIEVSAK